MKNMYISKLKKENSLSFKPDESRFSGFATKNIIDFLKQQSVQFWEFIKIQNTQNISMNNGG